jgi:hypothetical protein
VGCGASEGQNPSFDFSGITAFWDVVDTLLQDRSPSSEQWDRIFETPGYAALTASEFDPEFFKEQFALAYQPSREAERVAALDSATSTRFLRHYRRVGDARSQLEEQAGLLRRTPLCNDALTRSRAFLPEPQYTECPPVSFVIFANDGRGYDPIVVDLLASISWDIGPFLAHEFHHWIRNRQLAFDWSAVAAEDRDLLWVLDQLQAEGIADHIDKAAWMEDEAAIPTGRASYAAEYRRHVLDAAALLGTVDSLLCELSDSGADRLAAGARLRSMIPQSGHPTGFYMARTILETLGREALVQELGNPFNFVVRYQEATTRREGRPGFSSCATIALDTLRHRYERRPGGGS